MLCLNINLEYFGNNKIIPNYQINIPLICDGKKYVLRGESLMCAYNDKTVAIYVTKNVKSAENKKHLLRQYPTAYAIVAQIASEPDHAYCVNIIGEEGQKIIDGLTKRESERLLNEFYKRIHIESENRNIPFFDRGVYDATKGLLHDFNAYKKRFMDTEYNYYYIPSMEIMDPDCDLGFSDENFAKEYVAAFEHHHELIEPNLQKSDLSD